MPLNPFLLFAALAAAAPPAPVGETSVVALKQRFVSAVEQSEKNDALERLSATAPRDLGDISALYDLFMRFPETGSRRAALSSLELAPVHPTLEPLALTALRAEEPESVFFGAHLAAKAGTPAAVEELRKVAGRKLGRARAEDASMATERQAWWSQYEALDVLASLSAEKALPLLRSRAAESPAVGAILGRRLWKAGWTDLLRLAGSRKDSDRAAAREGARQPIESADARATREPMLKAVMDPKLDEEFRHQLALKVGASSDDAEAAELSLRHDAAKSEGERLLWASAVFASRRPAAIPLLARYAREDGDERRRRGALSQLADMVGPEKAKALVEGDKSVQK